MLIKTAGASVSTSDAGRDPDPPQRRTDRAGSIRPSLAVRS
jgi:hypothetical protein